MTEKVNKAIEKLNYFPDQMGRGLRKGQSNTIGLIVSDITNPFFPRVARGVEDCARENEYNVIFSNTDENPVEEQHYISLLRSQRVDGVIIAPTNEGEENIKPLLEQATPVVLIDRAIDSCDIPAIVSDNYSGAYKAVEYLIEKGHRDIGFVAGLKGVQSTDKRYEGYKKALIDHDIDFRDELVVMGNSQIQDSYRAMEKLWSNANEITAIFAANNLILIGVMQYLKDNSINFPEEISLICFDDPQWGSAVNPGITSVSQNPYGIGYKAGFRLFEEIHGSESKKETNQVVLPIELKERESVNQIN